MGSFAKFFEEDGIVRQYIIPNTSHQNEVANQIGVAKSRN